MTWSCPRMTSELMIVPETTCGVPADTDTPPPAPPEPLPVPMARIAGVGRGDVERALSVDRRGHGAGQDDAVLDGLDADFVVGHHGFQDVFEFADISPHHGDLECRDLAAVLVHGERCWSAPCPSP